MTDVLAPVPARRDAQTPAIAMPGRILLSTFSFAAGAIHLVMAPSHAGESTVEGAGFMIAGWLQIALAVLLLTQPSRLILRVSVGLNFGLIALWAVSRTYGLPFGAHAWHPEMVSSVDLTCVAIEGALLLVSMGLLTRPNFARSLDSSVLLTGVIVPIGVIALVSGVLLSPGARSHASGSHGDHGSAAGDSHGGESAGGHAHGPEGDDLGFAALSNGHQHETGEVDLDPRTQALLDDELAATRDLVDKYPTIADAEAGGYRRAGPFVPGLGTHYVNYGGYTGNNDDALEGSHETLVPVLIYDGLEPDAPIAGFMYMAYGAPAGQEPTGFVGPNDHWHYHTNTCIVYRNGVIEAPLGADLPDVTPELCDRYGGQLITNTGYMVHVWSVPGYESETGMFSEVSPALRCPDGTYYTKSYRELGWSKTLCKNGNAV
ncbi:MAG: hypothetical protein ACRDWD_05635 [Acidimicrobiia bacterium]